MTTYFKGKKILVCGGAGFTGTHLIKALSTLGADIRATLHQNKPQIKNEAVEWVNGDLRDAAFCAEATAGCDYVVNAAAVTSGAAVIQDSPLVHVTPNVILNTQLAEACYQNGVKKYLFISSNTVYPDLPHPVKEDEMFPGEPFDKYFPVAWMKRFGEILCRMYAEKISRPMTCLIVRPGNLYGPYDDFRRASSHVLPALIRKAIEGMNPFEVWGDGRDIKDFLYIEDYVQGLLAMLEKLDHPETLNIASGLPTCLRDVIPIILKITGMEDTPVEYNTSKPSMIPKRLINIEKASRLLDWRPQTSIEEGLGKTIDWYRENPAPDQ